MAPFTPNSRKANMIAMESRSVVARSRRAGRAGFRKQRRKLGRGCCSPPHTWCVTTRAK